MPKTARAPMRSDISLATVAWSWRKWESANKERPNPTKEALLRRSLDIVRGKKGNEEAVREIVEKSIEAGLFRLAMEAIDGFGADAAFDMYVSIKTLFEDVGTWSLLDKVFVERCERRVLDGKTARSGIGWGDHYTDQRSSALGVLGRFRLITGEPGMAVRLWAAGEDVIDVDEAIAETCDLIAQHAGSHLDYAISLTDLIRTETIRAKTLASLSEYA